MSVLSSLITDHEMCSVYGDWCLEVRAHHSWAIAAKASYFVVLILYIGTALPLQATSVL